MLDLNTRIRLSPEAPSRQHFRWEEFARLWDNNELDAAYDWLNARWMRLVRNRLGGHADPEAEFLQGLAFAVLTLYFTQQANQDGARSVLPDALVSLGKFRPRFLGVNVEPIVETLAELQPLLAGLPADAECPVWPFVYCKFDYRR